MYQFQSIVRKEKDHPYANYQLAISLLKQNDAEKATLAEIYLANAFKVLPALKTRYQKDMPQLAETPKESPVVPAISPVNTSGKPETNSPKPSSPAPAKVPTGKVPQSPAGNAVKDPAVPGSSAKKPVEKNGLDTYVEQLKHSYKTGGAATAMLTPGLNAYHGIAYFEQGDFGIAESNFSISLAKDSTNPYVNYLKALSIAAQGRKNDSKLFLAKAVAGDGSLANRFANDAAAASKKWEQQKAKNTIKPAKSEPVKYGGDLVYGNYTCHVTVWNGPNATPAYRNDYKGYFTLKKDGSYRWLDDGPSGKFSYTKTNGELKWLSGYFKGFAPKITQYQPGNKTAQITITFSDNNRWECGYDK